MTLEEKYGEYLNNKQVNKQIQEESKFLKNVFRLYQEETDGHFKSLYKKDVSASLKRLSKLKSSLKGEINK